MARTKIVVIIDDIDREKLQALIQKSGIDIQYLGVSRVDDRKVSGWGPQTKEALTNLFWGVRK